MLVLGFLHNPKSSLNDLSEFSEDHFALGITPQGIDARINDYALSFVRTMFDTALDMFRHTVPIPIPLIEQFSAVNITDSTVITLPETLSDEFPGSGGSASKVVLELQLISDFLSGCFEAVALTNGITPDQRYQEHIDKAEPDSPNLFDLGYFAISHLRDFADKGAYFLCRLLPGTGLFTNDGTKSYLAVLLINEIRNCFELELCLGKIIPGCRVCFSEVPDETARLRRQNAKKKAAQKGRTPKLLFRFVTMPLRCKNINLSPTKASERFAGRASLLADTLCSLKRLSEQMERICSAILKFGKREKRKKHLPTCHKLLTEEDYYSYLDAYGIRSPCARKPCTPYFFAWFCRSLPSRLFQMSAMIITQ